MKFLTLTVFALTLATGLSAPAQSDDRVGDLVNAALGYYQQALKKADPLPLLPVYKTHFYWLNPAVDITFSASNRSASGYSNMVVENMKTDSNQLTAEYQTRFPEMSQNFDYEVSGKYANKTVSGKGHVKLTVTNFTATFNDIKFKEYNFLKFHSLRLSSLNETFSFDDYTVDITGLTIEGVPDHDVAKYVQEQTVKIFNQFKSKLEKLSSLVLRLNLNGLMFGHSMEQITEWLKAHTKSQEFHHLFFAFDADHFVNMS